MNCYFCHQPMIAATVNAVDTTTPILLYYDCHKCQAFYEYSCEKDCLDYYRFRVGDLVAHFYSDKIFRLYKFATDILLLELSFSPNLTPTNLLKRYKTLITFS
jgi:hypothetical protein